MTDDANSLSEQMIRALLVRIETAEAQAREAAMQSLAHLGQAEEAWAAQKKAEAEADALRALIESDEQEAET